jgi:hypothetical protein
MPILYTFVKPLEVSELVYPDTITYTVPSGCCDLWYGLSTGWGALIEDAGEQLLSITQDGQIVFALTLDTTNFQTEDGWPICRIFEEGMEVGGDMTGGLGYEVGFAMFVLRFGATLASGFVPPTNILRAQGL